MPNDPTTRPPTLLWLRRDLRLGDHPGWAAALEPGGPVVPVFILDPVIEDAYGAAPLWRLAESLADLAAALGAKGSRLILRRGAAQAVLDDLIRETGARRVVWSRLYDSASIVRDRDIKASLKDSGVEAVSVNASLLFEPWEVETKTGGFYKVYTPFWRAVRDRDIDIPMSAPGDLAAPQTWPQSDRLADWRLGAAMDRGAAVVARHANVGEARAEGRLGAFIGQKIDRYKADRDLPGEEATSRLSENLTYGEPAAAPWTGWAASAPGRPKAS